MRVLLTNDDGYLAPGIIALRDFLKKDHEVWTVAPHMERSATSHGLTLREVLRLKQVDEKTYACNGLPADCVKLALHHLMLESPPDLVISGINRGSNLGQDIYYSGTCAGAREASFYGFPSLALSLNGKSWETLYFENLFPIVDKIIRERIDKILPACSSLNINGPNVEKLDSKPVLCPIGFASYDGGVRKGLDPKGGSYYWLETGERLSNESGRNTDIYWAEIMERLTVSLCCWTELERGLKDKALELLRMRLE